MLKNRFGSDLGKDSYLSGKSLEQNPLTKKYDFKVDRRTRMDFFNYYQRFKAHTQCNKKIYRSSEARNFCKDRLLFE